jgi:outer membrane protein OmpA-like peptidoglycan-associated protein
VRHVVVPAIALALLAMPVRGRADDQNVQSLIGQLRPRAPGQAIVTRGLPKPGAPATPASAASPGPAASHATTAAHAPTASRATTASATTAEAPSADLNVLFVTGSADLTPSATRLLDDLGRALSDASMGESHFLIEGHTDTVGDRDANQALSERRAAAVMTYLVTKFHIPAARLSAKGLGQEALLVPTPDQTPEPRNRRVHVVNLGS